MIALSKRTFLMGAMAFATARPAFAARPLIAHLALADVPAPKGKMQRELSVDPDTGATTLLVNAYFITWS